ncbi:unnamed protein product [Brassica rapa]|uniref:Uncharacterized protein n=1 Tax=Brassica campestris TaxID=3711 RepID=A0A8D9GYK8_BRACM|nr:unnamed protein product [Brassica rapa]
MMKDTCKEKRGFILKRTQSNDYSLTLGWMRTKMRYHREHITAGDSTPSKNSHTLLL